MVKGGLDLTIEDVFRLAGEYAGIHSFQFDDDIADDFDDADAWDTGGATGTWTIDTERLKGVGPGGSAWGFCLSDTYEAPKAFVLEVDAESLYGAVVILATDADNFVWCWWTLSNVGISRYVGGTDAVLCSVPKYADYPHTMRISVQPAIDGDECFISWWSNGAFMANAHLDTYPAGRKIGFGSYHTNTVYFDDLRIPELTEVPEVVTLDVGETPGGALQRALGRRHINYYVRFEGGLRAWRPKVVASSLTLGTGDVSAHTEAIDRRGLVSHWRQVGAWDSADAFDEDLLEQIGHRFHKDDNPDLMTQEDCQTEAEHSLVRAQEYAHQLQADMPFCVLLEPEDRLTIDGEEWLLTSVTVKLLAGALEAGASLREYTYE